MTYSLTVKVALVLIIIVVALFFYSKHKMEDK